MNNPVRYIDPSGHDRCSGQPDVWTPDCGVILDPDVEFFYAFQNPLHGDHDNYRGFGDYRGIYKRNEEDKGKDKWHASIDAGGNNNFGDWVYPILPGEGEVIWTGWDETGFGNYVIIKHTVDGKNYYTIYAHYGSTKNDNGIYVKRGDKVYPLNPIGILGNSTSGHSSSACPPGTVGCMDAHLHFEVRYEENVNTSGNVSPLNDRRYWAFDKYWRYDFYDLGLIYGYAPNPENYLLP